MIGLYEIDRIYSVTGTLQITRSNNMRDTQCKFSTYDAVQEWDEIIIENDYATREFGGIVEQPLISLQNNVAVYTITSRGYKKLFDRDKVAETFSSVLAGDAVRSIIADSAPDFDDSGVDDGITIDSIVFNYGLPSECISRIASAIGYVWNIDEYKTVHFGADDAVNAPVGITSDQSFWSNLKITPDISNLCNVVIVRGGTYLSETVDYYEIADGVKTQFVLPEKPHDVHVYVNGVEQTVGIKFGEETATEQFQVNFDQKYIENGTAATLSDGDELHVTYTYDVPIRVQRKNLVSIAAMQTLFPGTNGEFLQVIQDDTIDSRDLAYAVAQQNLDAYSNALVTCTFDTDEDLFAPGQVLPIVQSVFTGSAVIQKIISKNIAGSNWVHSVTAATVLFGFEEFMRTLYASTKVDLIDGETLETSNDFEDTVGLSETLTASIDLHRQTEGVGIDDDLYAAANHSVSYVLGDYFPADHADGSRVFILDGSPLP